MIPMEDRIVKRRIVLYLLPLVLITFGMVLTASAETDKEIRFGIRVNIDIGQGFVSRFGIDETELNRVFELAGRVGNAVISGLQLLSSI